MIGMWESTGARSCALSSHPYLQQTNSLPPGTSSLCQAMVKEKAVPKEEDEIFPPPCLQRCTIADITTRREAWTIRGAYSKACRKSMCVCSALIKAFSQPVSIPRRNRLDELYYRELLPVLTKGTLDRRSGELQSCHSSLIGERVSHLKRAPLRAARSHTARRTCRHQGRGRQL